MDVSIPKKSNGRSQTDGIVGGREIMPRKEQVDLYTARIEREQEVERLRNLPRAERDRLCNLQNSKAREEQQKLREEAKQQSQLPTTRWQLRTSINDAKQKLIDFDVSGSAFEKERDDLLIKFCYLEIDCNRDISSQLLSKYIEKFKGLRMELQVLILKIDNN